MCVRGVDWAHQTSLIHILKYRNMLETWVVDMYVRGVNVASLSTIFMQNVYYILELFPNVVFLDFYLIILLRVDVCAHATRLTTSEGIVSSQERERSCIGGVEFDPVSTSFRLEFGIVSTMVFLVFFI